MEDDSTTNTARPSPSQKAYRDDPQGFLARLEERAAALFESGYRVTPGPEAHLFLVSHQGRKEKVEYEVRPREGACTCPFYARQAAGEYLGTDASIIPCKHLIGLPGLVRKTRHEAYREGRVSAFCALTCHWMKYRDAQRKERIAAEKAKASHGAGATVSPIGHREPTRSAQPLTGFRSCGTGWQSSGKENGKWRR